MNMWVIGISHKTAPIHVREKFYLKETERALLLSILKNDPRVTEAIVVSTCNRIEIYVSILDDLGPEFVLQEMLKLKHITEENWQRYFYILKGDAALEHLLRVSAGLDSLVLGEKQILGQIKTAVELSRKMGILGKSFNIMANIAIRTGKKAQSETEVGYGGVSMSWAAVVMAQNFLGTLEGKSALLIGAGKMSKLAVNHFAHKKMQNIFVMNRTHDKAALLAQQCGGTEVPFWDLKETLARVDVCICAASAPHYLINTALVQEIMPLRLTRPLILIDISMPRNIEPSVVEIPGVSLLAIDDLAKVTEDSLKKRNEAIEQVEQIVRQKIEEFHTKWAKVQSLEFEYAGMKEDF